MSSYTVSKVKTVRGRNGNGFTCAILRDGKQVGSAEDWADGGPTNIRLDNTAFYAELGEKFQFEKAEGYIEDLVNDFQEKKKLNRLAKKYVLFRLKGDIEGNWRYRVTPASAQEMARFKSTYGDKLEAIYEIQ